MRLQIHIRVQAEKQVCNGEEAGAPGAVRWPLWRVAGRQERKIAGAEEGRKVEHMWRVAGDKFCGSEWMEYETIHKWMCTSQRLLRSSLENIT